MNIQVLASGSRGNAYIVDDGQTKILLECGISWRELQKASNFTMSTVSACLISHEHKDHCKSVADVLRAGITVYSSNGTAKALNVKNRRSKACERMQDFTVGTFVVKPFDVYHDAAEPFGFVLHSTATQETVLFATDTVFIKYMFKGLTHIMLEANYDYDLMRQGNTDLNKRIMHSHMSIDTFLAWCNANDLSKVKQIYLLHLSDERSDAEGFKKQVQELTGAEVYIA